MRDAFVGCAMLAHVGCYILNRIQMKNCIGLIRSTRTHIHGRKLIERNRSEIFIRGKHVFIVLGGGEDKMMKTLTSAIGASGLFIVKRIRNYANNLLVHCVQRVAEHRAENGKVDPEIHR